MASELDSLIDEVKTRRFLWMSLRLLASAVAVGAIFISLGVPSTWYWALALVPIVASLFKPTSDEMPAVIDDLGGHDGQLQCAYDHRDRAGAVIEAQRERAVRSARSMSVETYAPRPHWGWCMPIPVLLFAVLMMDEPTLEPASKGAMVVNATSETERNLPGSIRETQTTKDPVIGDDRAQAIARSEDRSSDLPEGRPRAAAGRKTGASTSGSSAPRNVARIEAGKDVALLTIDSKVRRRTSNASDEAIAEPARPFPPKYQAVISAWFNRRTE